MKNEFKIPQATTKRLPLYYRFLQNFASEGKKRISSQELSEAMKIDSATIRRDFSYFGALGKKGYGYDVLYLLEFFRQTLDQDEGANVALIGVGNLGNAFLKYNFQKNHNTRIVVAFDSKAPHEGMEVSGIPVYHPDRLEEMYLRISSRIGNINCIFSICSIGNGSFSSNRCKRCIKFYTSKTKCYQIR